jgi:ABC-2 type transport system permease protein
MNTTIAGLTLRTLLGRRRAWLLLVLPVALLLLSAVLRLTVGQDDRTDAAIVVLGAFAIATVVPLIALIAGTGALGGEIDDGSIVYLLSKPVSRHVIITTKLAVSGAVVTLFGAVPVFLAGLVLVGGQDRLAVAYGLGALVAGVTYCAAFLLLSVLTRSAVVVGLVYALVWADRGGASRDLGGAPAGRPRRRHLPRGTPAAQPAAHCCRLSTVGSTRVGVLRLGGPGEHPVAVHLRRLDRPVRRR